MPEQPPVQIFMSYAWKDNTIPPNDPSAEAGFVSALAEQIHYEFDTSDSKPKLWWDRDKIDEAQQFDPLIEDAIERSSLFLIILSGHWLASAYCQQELELFRRRWKHLDDFQFQHRIILAHKTVITEERRPKILPRQSGFQFFTTSSDGVESPFHRRGKGDKRFFSTAGDLGRILVRHANHKEPGPIEAPPAPPPRRAVNPEAHTVYLAKPAGDMREEYLRLHEELSANGYNVTPPLDAEIPDDASAVQLIDDALKEAVISVHLVGRGRGSTPEGLTEPIVPLQLTRAETKVVTEQTEIAAKPDRTKPDSPRFHRIIWAPAILMNGDGKLVSRGPIDAFNTVGRHQAGDQIEGESLNPFIVSLKQHLRAIPRKRKDPPRIAAGAKIYLCHDLPDSLYAADWQNVLNEGKYDVETPAYFGTSDHDRAKHHQKQLSECSAVIMCWAEGSELWARTQSKELANWETLGRTGEFLTRGLIAGPPPHIRKDDKVLRQLFPPREIDVVVNMTSAKNPSLDTIRSIFESGPDPAP